MIRITRGNIAANKRKKYLKLAKGYRGNNSRLSIFAKEQVKQSLYFAYKSRRLKKRFFKRLWIYRINTAARINLFNYSNYINLLRKNNIFLNKKILAFFAFHKIFIINLIKRFLK
jgi:large subunit ribosomal protein L20